MVRIGQVNDFSVCLVNLVNNAGRCGDKIQVILSLQTLLDDLQMEKSKESAAETKSKGYRCLRLIEKGSIVELQLLQCIPKIPDTWHHLPGKGRSKP